MRWPHRLRERRRWARAHTLDDLDELTAQWLEGRIKSQPGYCGPVDVDRDLAPDLPDTLIRLNRAGLVTIGSQAGWDGTDRCGRGFRSAAAVEGFASPSTAEALGRALHGSEYRILTHSAAAIGWRRAKDGMTVSYLDGRPYTIFGRQLHRRSIATRIYPGCHRDAIDAVSAAGQIVIYDPAIGRNTLWVALNAAVHQLEQETNDLSSYDDDPRVSAHGDGYAVTRADGSTVHVLPTGVFGWAIYHGPNLDLVPTSDGGFATGYTGADDAIGAVLTDQDTDNTSSGNTTSEATADEPAADEPIAGKPAAGRGYRDADHLRHLADRCEKAAETLTYDGEHAAQVLAERGYPDADAQEWAQRKQAAAAAAREYAAGLRTEAAGLDEGGRPSGQRIQQAEKVASAAELGGILIDGSRLDAAALESPWNDEAMKQAIRDHGAAERAAVEGSALFEHVAEDGQVPFWQLGHAERVDTSTNNDQAASTADDDTTSSGTTGSGDRDAHDRPAGTYRIVGGDGSSTGGPGPRRAPGNAAADAADKPTAGHQPVGGSSGPHVGAHAGAGETVTVVGDAVGSRTYSAHKTGRDRGTTRADDTAAAAGGAVNIGAVTIGSGRVNAGGDIVGQRTSCRQDSHAGRQAGSEAAADDCDGM